MEKKTAGSVLITGGTGFVGRHLLRHLSPDFQVWITSRTAAGKNCLQTDLTNPKMLQDFIRQKGVSTVFHLASQSSVHQSFQKPIKTVMDNIQTALTVIEAVAGLATPPLLITAGSADVYQNTDTALVETMPEEPKSAYGLSKLIPDIMAKYQSLFSNFPWVHLRLFNHSGPGQNTQFVLGSFADQIAQIKMGKIPPVLRVGNLSAQRDFTDIRDVCRAYSALIHSQPKHQVYNICSGQCYQIGDLLKKLIQISGVSIDIQQDPEKMRPSDIPLILGNPSRFASEFNWKATIPIEQTLADLLESRLAIYK